MTEIFVQNSDLPKSNYLTKAGSHAYGLNTPKSDMDYRGFFFPERKHVMGFLHGPEQRELMANGNDFVSWDVRKFCRLAAQANPNVIETLFTSPEDRIAVDFASEIILNNKDLFLSRRIARTYLGYATSNLKRIMKSSEYDGKDAMHLVRLLRTGEEALRTGVLRVKRTEDREELLAIRNHEVTFPEIQKISDDLTNKIKSLEENSPLRPEPEEDKLNDVVCLAMEAVRLTW
jgi:hypothetical protein